MSVANIEREQLGTVERSGMPSALANRGYVGPLPSFREVDRNDVSVRPQVNVHVQIQERRRVQRSNGHEWAIRAVVCGVVFVGTYVARSLGGQVRVEDARRREMTARSRASEASRAEFALQSEVDFIKSPAEIDRWAKTHGFIQPTLIASAHSPAPQD